MKDDTLLWGEKEKLGKNLTRILSYQLARNEERFSLSFWSLVIVSNDTFFFYHRGNISLDDVSGKMKALLVHSGYILAEWRLDYANLGEEIRELPLTGILAREKRQVAGTGKREKRIRSKKRILINEYVWVIPF